MNNKNYKMTKEEEAYSNKRQREVFGWSDEDEAKRIANRNLFEILIDWLLK